MIPVKYLFIFIKYYTSAHASTPPYGTTKHVFYFIFIRGIFKPYMKRVNWRYHEIEPTTSPDTKAIFGLVVEDGMDVERKGIVSCSIIWIVQKKMESNENQWNLFHPIRLITLIFLFLQFGRNGMKPNFWFFITL